MLFWMWKDSKTVRTMLGRCDVIWGRRDPDVHRNPDVRLETYGLKSMYPYHYVTFWTGTSRSRYASSRLNLYRKDPHIATGQHFWTDSSRHLRYPVFNAGWVSIIWKWSFCMACPSTHQHDVGMRAMASRCGHIHEHTEFNICDQGVLLVLWNCLSMTVPWQKSPAMQPKSSVWNNLDIVFSPLTAWRCLHGLELISLDERMGVS